MKTMSATVIALFLSVVSIQDIQATIMYDFEGVVTHASTGCSFDCGVIPEGYSLYSPSDTFTGTLSWNYDTATALSPAPNTILADPWFSYSIDFNGLLFSQSTYFKLRDGSFYHEDEQPGLSLRDGLYLGQQDAFRIFFNSTTYTPDDGLPVNLDFSEFDSITVNLSALLDYSWDIEGIVTSYTAVTAPSSGSIVLLGSGLLGLIGMARRKQSV